MLASFGRGVRGALVFAFALTLALVVVRFEL
jgi:hypothetical protein